ncbi:MAG: 6,7-dimethyl-8-ribityllumazine synthase [Acidimicrobiaceae bacterium]|jgi:6,7-dimethyl-8-ribityllumazine synthase|nr:6,7-dimethyl-8-ribityllumazine synthase [Acidimicrobiaceae bacterium]|tara:strand:+ start:124515 stop:125012 length:498 start_codon:yes stop_codon:yes gene_type:complete
MTTENKNTASQIPLRIGIVAGKFNLEITQKLIEGALAYLNSEGIQEDCIDIHWVPGAFEIPFACNAIAKSNAVDGLITLGAVVRGGTPHFEFVAGECARGVREVSIQTGIPIAFGVLTTDTLEQALQRSDTSYIDHDGSTGDKGSAAASAILEMIKLIQSLSSRS